jgi:hypothetical protein
MIVASRLTLFALMTPLCISLTTMTERIRIIPSTPILLASL